MKRFTLILLSFLLTTGCATDGKFSSSRKFEISPETLAALSDTCDPDGGTSAKLDYGYTGSTKNAKKRIKIKGLVHVVPDKYFAIELNPKGNAEIRPGLTVEDLDVTVSGKDADSAWLKAGPASYNDTEPDGYRLLICVPENQPDGEYFYDINVKEIGTLDPRADVC